MSKRTTILSILAAAIAIVLGTFVLIRSLHRQQSDSQTAAVSEPAPRPVSEHQILYPYEKAPSESVEEYKARMRALVETMISTNYYPDYARYYLEQSQVDRQFDWKQPINFYGKVVDEKGQPIEGASVNMSWNDLSEEGTAKANMLSDINGLFALEGQQGKRLSVSVAKKGYYSPPIGWIKSFEYANPFEANFHRPDAGNPVVFHLYKKGPGTDLITSRKGFSPALKAQLPLEGGPVRVDVLNRKVGPTGQIELSQTKPPYLSWRDATHWSFRIAIPDGGLVEHNEEFPFEAPETGYHPFIEFNLLKNSTNWTLHLEKDFYIKFGNPPRYGRLRLETGIMDESARLKYAINPTGSRYLEPKTEPYHTRFE